MFFIRTATLTDLPKVQTLLRESWLDTYAEHEGEEKILDISRQWHSLDRLKQQLEQPRSEFVLADDGQTIGGMGYAMQTGEAIADIKQLHVAPPFHGQGIGGDMLAELEMGFPGVKTMRLEAHPGNQNAIRFYEKRGYVKTSEADKCDGEFDLPAVMMEKKLDGWEL
jgi:ribosomal protein S18 acetylase RimI-like enzyme